MLYCPHLRTLKKHCNWKYFFFFSLVKLVPFVTFSSLDSPIDDIWGLLVLMFYGCCRRGIFWRHPCWAVLLFCFLKAVSPSTESERKDVRGCNVCACMLRTHRKSFAELNMSSNTQRGKEKNIKRNAHSKGKNGADCSTQCAPWVLHHGCLYKGLVFFENCCLYRCNFFSYVRNNCCSQLLILTTLWCMLSRADGVAWEMFHGGLTSECQLLALNYNDSLCGLLCMI